MYAVFMKHQYHDRVRSKTFEDEATARGFVHGYNYANKAFNGNSKAWVQYLPTPSAHLPEPPDPFLDEG